MAKITTFFIFIIVLFVFINGCNATGNFVKENYYENNVEVKAYFCPEDKCEEIIIDNILDAKNSVHCAFYDFDLENLIMLLAKKSHEVNVRVVIDKNNYDEQIKGEGIKVAGASPMHNKFCVIDNGKVLTGSTNPTNNGVNLNNNNLVIIDSKYIAENYENEFEELWNGVYSSGNNVEFSEVKTNIGIIENYFCPEDCKFEYHENPKDFQDAENRKLFEFSIFVHDSGIYRIIELVKNAKQSIKLASFSFTHEALADELIKASMRGINVSILIEKRQRNTQNSQYERLKDFNIDIRVDGNKHNMHHKFMVIDENIIITGSPNFTLSGFNKNDENMLIVFNEGLAFKYADEFNRLFDVGEVV